MENLLYPIPLAILWFYLYVAIKDKRLFPFGTFLSVSALLFSSVILVVAIQGTLEKRAIDQKYEADLRRLEKENAKVNAFMDSESVLANTGKLTTKIK